MKNKDYMEGVRAAQHYYNSQAYGCFTRYARAEDVIKLFLPSVTEALTMISSPLPKPRRDWIRGFKEEQANILADLENEK